VLSTTSYAVLGMLAIRPWSAYELTKQMRRSLAYCWPKAESVLYDEPKRLARLGLATVTAEASSTGQARSRAVYAITPDGERVLRNWLATEPAPPRFESEPALRLLFADHGSANDLLRTVESVQSWVRAEAVRGRDQVQDYRDGGGPFPQRRHISVLFADLYARMFAAINDWASEARAEIATWPDTRDLGLTDGTRGRITNIIARIDGVLAHGDPAQGGPYDNSVL